MCGHVCVCVCVCVCMCVLSMCVYLCVHKCVSLCVHGRQGSMKTLLNRSLLNFFEVGSYTECVPHQFDWTSWPANSWDLLVFSSPILRLSTNMGAEELSSGPHSYKANPLIISTAPRLLLLDGQYFFSPFIVVCQKVRTFFFRLLLNNYWFYYSLEITLTNSIRGVTPGYAVFLLQRGN